MGGLLLSGGGWGGTGSSISMGLSLRLKAELALLCEVPGLRPLGEGSLLLGVGYPFALRWSAEEMPSPAPLIVGSSCDFWDI